MDQLENSRKMLSGVEKSPVKEKRCTIWVSQTFRKRLKRFCFWFSENGGMEEPTQMKILEEALDFYLREKFPNAEK